MEINIGENIRKIRELNGFTQENLANELGITQKTYSNLESAGNNISYERILKIADVFKIDVSKILNLNTEMILNSNYQQGGINYLKNESVLNYNDEQVKLYERIIQEKDKLLKEKERLIEVLCGNRN